MRKLVVAATAVLVLGGCETVQALVTMREPLDWSAGETITVPFRSDGAGRIVVDGAVDGRPVPIVLDTGATFGAVESAFALPLPPGVREVRHEVNGEKRTTWAGMVFQIGALRIPVARTSELAPQNGFDALLGSPLFDRAIVDIDPAASTVTIRPPSDQYVPPSGAVAMAFGDMSGTPTLLVDLGEGRQTCVMIDTGYSGAFAVAESEVRRFSLPTDPDGRTVTMLGPAGERWNLAALAPLPKLTIAGQTLDNVMLQPSPWGPEACHNNVGMRILAAYRLIFDLGNHRGWLIPRRS